jgi:hypothetical protein
MAPERNVRKGTSAGTDGSQLDADEDFFEQGADHSVEESDGVGTDGSLANPEQQTRTKHKRAASYRDTNHRT